jgi:hypothetical protein
MSFCFRNGHSFHPVRYLCALALLAILFMPQAGAAEAGAGTLHALSVQVDGPLTQTQYSGRDSYTQRLKCERCRQNCYRRFLERCNPGVLPRPWPGYPRCGATRFNRCIRLECHQHCYVL